MPAQGCPVSLAGPLSPRPPPPSPPPSPVQPPVWARPPAPAAMALPAPLACAAAASAPASTWRVAAALPVAHSGAALLQLRLPPEVAWLLPRGEGRAVQAVWVVA